MQYNESELAEALEAYTDPDHPEFDPEFDAEIRSLRPDWFEDENAQRIEAGNKTTGQRTGRLLSEGF